MTDDLKLEIASHQKELAQLALNLPAPEMILTKHRGESYMMGNESAYINLASDLLNVAQGKNFYPRSGTWMKARGWALGEVSLHKAPFAFSEPNTSFRAPGLVMIVIAFLALTLIGATTTVEFFYHWATAATH